jgi:hypothetical protein
MGYESNYHVELQMASVADNLGKKEKEYLKRAFEMLWYKDDTK